MRVAYNDHLRTFLKTEIQMRDWELTKQKTDDNLPVNFWCLASDLKFLIIFNKVLKFKG